MSADAISPTQASPFCPQHPEVVASFVCARCQSAVCVDCCYSLPDGSICCKACWETPAPEPTAKVSAAVKVRLVRHEPTVEALPTTPLPPGSGCVQHPNVVPVAYCKMCGVGCCRTCDFVFPGNLHYCPVCVVSATRKLSPRRKKYLITAFWMAGGASLGLLVFMSGALAGMAKDRPSQMALGVVFLLGLGIPSVIGTAMAMSAMTKGANPISVWIALMWNSMMLAAMVAMTVIGNLTK